MMRDKKDIRPLLVQLGAALAISLAGFLFSRMKGRSAKFSRRPGSPSSTDDVGEVDGGKAVLKKTSSLGNIASVPAEKQQKDTYIPKVASDNRTVVRSPNIRNSGEKGGFLLPEFDDIVEEFDLNATKAAISLKGQEFPRLDMENPRAFTSTENDGREQEIRHLKNMVRTLREREKNLEVQLLEFYGLKEQETAMTELQNRLKINNMEVKLFNVKIENLRVDNERLKAQVADHAKIVADLDAARAKIKLLRKMLKTEAEQNKEQILTLQKRVTRLQEQELKAAATDSDIQFRLERLKDLEVEVEDLRQSNSKLHLENSELALQLESYQLLAKSALEDSEREALKELSNQLRKENEHLAKEVERLQSERCTDVEELVYLRWINACLRYELRNFQPPNGKTVARDLSKSLSPTSEKKAKQLILEYADTEGIGEKAIDFIDFESDQWPSSHNSYIIDPADDEDSSVPTQSKNESKIKIFNKLRRLLTGKDAQHHNNRSSTGKTGAEDSDSLPSSSNISTTTDAANDMHSDRAKSLSPDIPRYPLRHSADIQRLKSASMDEMKDMKIGRRNSDIGSSYGHRKFLSGRITAGDFLTEDKDSFPIEKSELLKFAAVLKDSDKTRKWHRKSTSLGAF